tara:strand:- start:204 stop:761 length:558 start_codon:yes stop_codon:yes gene_type:complete
MPKKKKRELSIGDHIKEIGLKKRVGEIVSILEDSKTNPTIECIEIHEKELYPIERSTGEYKKFKVKKNNCKQYTPRKNLFKKEGFKSGGYLMNKMGGRVRYGMIVGFLNQEEGLYPHSYDTGEHNGKDLLECIQVQPDLRRMLDADGKPVKFISDPSNCKPVKVIRTDDKGNPITDVRLDVPNNE